jgi:hypothetical protein
MSAAPRTQPIASIVDLGELPLDRDVAGHMKVHAMTYVFEPLSSPRLFFILLSSHNRLDYATYANVYIIHSIPGPEFFHLGQHD